MSTFQRAVVITIVFSSLSAFAARQCVDGRDYQIKRNTVSNFKTYLLARNSGKSEKENPALFASPENTRRRQSTEILGMFILARAAGREFCFDLEKGVGGKPSFGNALPDFNRKRLLVTFENQQMCIDPSRFEIQGNEMNQTTFIRYRSDRSAQFPMFADEVVSKESRSEIFGLFQVAKDQGALFCFNPNNLNDRPRVGRSLTSEEISGADDNEVLLHR